MCARPGLQRLRLQALEGGWALRRRARLQLRRAGATGHVPDAGNAVAHPTVRLFPFIVVTNRYSLHAARTLRADTCCFSLICDAAVFRRDSGLGGCPLRGGGPDEQGVLPDPGEVPHGATALQHGASIPAHAVSERASERALKQSTPPPLCEYTPQQHAVAHREGWL